MQTRRQPAITPERRRLPLTDLPSLMAAQDRAVVVPMRQDVPRGLGAEVVAILYPMLDEFIDGVIRTVEDMRPADAVPLDGAYEQNLRTGVTAALQQFTRVVDEGDASAVDLEIFRELGRKHALVGYPLEDLLWLYRVGAMACWRQATELYRLGRFEDDVLVRVGELVFTLSHVLSEAATAGYASEATSTSTLAQARRLEFLRRLLTGSERLSEHELERAATEVGSVLPQRLAVVVAAIAPDALGLAYSFGPEVLLEGPIGQQHVALLAVQGDDPPALTRPTGGSTVAVGPAVHPLDARRSFEDAVRLLDLVDRGVVPAAPVVRVADCWVALLLDRNPHLVGDLVNRRLGGVMALVERRRTPMLDTLIAWLARPGQISAIAEELHVHTQTVRYRLDRLRELVGSCIDEPAERLELALAAHALRHELLPAEG